MIEDHIDPTAEAHNHMSNLLRTVITSAAGMADKRAQRRQAEMQEIQRRSEAERRVFTERMTAERQAAELVYRRAYQDSWWDRARPEAIASAVAAAGAWAATDPKANDALSHIAEQLENRYGVDLAQAYRDAADPTAVPGQVRADVAQVQQDWSAAVTAETQEAEQAAGGTTPWEAEVLAVAGPTLGRQILDSEGWNHLEHRLDALDAAGEDVTERLRGAVTQRELDSAKDKGVTLAWRLKTPAAGASGGQDSAAAARRAAEGSRPPGQQPSKGSGSSRGMSPLDRQRANLADKQRSTGPERDSGPEAAAG